MIVDLNNTPGPASRRYAELYDRIRELNRIADNQHCTYAERQAAREEREPLTVEAGEVFNDVLAEHEGISPAKPVILDRGLVLLVAGTLLQIRHQIDRELERNDLTPYMWSSLIGKRDAISKVFRMLEGRPLKKIDDWVIPQHLLTAEFDDDSIDFKEALDDDEAQEIEDDYVERGAVVTHYRTYPETGDKIVLFYPVLPHENGHRQMTQRQYNWTLRKKGAHNLNLPESLDGLVTHGFYDRPEGDDDDN